jgi:hypothetical protein
MRHVYLAVIFVVMTTLVFTALVALGRRSGDRIAVGQYAIQIPVKIIVSDMTIATKSIEGQYVRWLSMGSSLRHDVV